MSAIGETLRRERERQGLSLQTLSETTKIGTRMLQAIETGDYTRLPGGMLTRSFIKQYAVALGLDPGFLESELNELRLEAEESSHSRQPSFVPREAASSGSFVPIAVWVLLGAGVCGAVYYVLRPKEPTPTPLEAAHISESAKPQKKVASPVQTPAAERALENAPVVGAVQVSLSASEASWVSITVDGKLTFSGILQPNDHREFNAEKKIKLVAGNAGGIDIALNGKTIDALGPRGQPRTVELTRTGAQVVSRLPKAEPLF